MFFFINFIYAFDDFVLLLLFILKKLVTIDVSVILSKNEVLKVRLR